MAEPTHIIGSRNTLTIEQSQRIPDVDDKIFLLEPGESPLTAFLTQIGKIGDGGGKWVDCYDILRGSSTARHGQGIDADKGRGKPQDEKRDT